MFTHKNLYVKFPAHIYVTKFISERGWRESGRYKIEIGNKKKKFKGRWRGKCDTDKWEEDEEAGLCVHGADGGVG